MSERIAEALEALVEQQRIANLIALADTSSRILGDQVAVDAANLIAEFHKHERESLGGWHELRPDIAAALGLTEGGAE